MKRRIFAWVLLIGFVFLIVNITLFFLNIHLSEFHSIIMKISTIVYIAILFVLLIFKMRDDMRKRNKNDMDMMMNVQNNDTGNEKPDEINNKTKDKN
jgi:hypothetical protein